jgi:hypothetical protein
MASSPDTSDARGTAHPRPGAAEGSADRVADDSADRSAGRAFALLLLAIAAFQVALGAGAPWGAAAWGGTHSGVLPTRLRLASGVAAVVWLFVAAVADGRLLGRTGRRRWLVGVAAYVTVGVLLNAISRSALERAVWVPVCLVGAVLGWRAVRASRREDG